MFGVCALAVKVTMSMLIAFMYRFAHHSASIRAWFLFDLGPVGGAQNQVRLALSHACFFQSCSLGLELKPILLMCCKVTCTLGFLVACAWFLGLWVSQCLECFSSVLFWISVTSLSCSFKPEGLFVCKDTHYIWSA